MLRLCTTLYVDGRADVWELSQLVMSHVSLPPSHEERMRGITILRNYSTAQSPTACSNNVHHPIYCNAHRQINRQHDYVRETRKLRTTQLNLNDIITIPYYHPRNHTHIRKRKHTHTCKLTNKRIFQHNREMNNKQTGINLSE